MRQKDAPVAVFEPADSSQPRDCWTVRLLALLSTAACSSPAPSFKERAPAGIQGPSFSPDGRARPRRQVAFGNSYNDEERCLLAGYDNGDVKMFDLRTGTIRYETNIKNGVRSLFWLRR